MTITKFGGSLAAIQTDSWAVLADGRIVAFREPGTFNGDAALDIFSPDGQLISSRIVASPGLPGLSGFGIVTALDDGSFVVEYESSVAGTDQHIYVRSFAADGTPTSAAVLATETTGGHQDEGHIIATGGDSFYLSFWDDSHQNDQYSPLLTPSGNWTANSANRELDVRGRFFNLADTHEIDLENGRSTGGSTTATYDRHAGTQIAGDVSQLANGKIAVAFLSPTYYLGSFDIVSPLATVMMELVSSNGTVSSPVLVDAETSSYQIAPIPRPGTLALVGGGFVVSWDRQLVGGGANQGVYEHMVRFYDANGTATTNAIDLYNSAPNESLNYLPTSMVALKGGGFAVLHDVVEATNAVSQNVVLGVYDQSGVLADSITIAATADNETAGRLSLAPDGSLYAEYVDLTTHLAIVQRYVLPGTGDFAKTGLGGADTIVSTSASGHQGWVDGGAGDDLLIAGAGTDVVYGNLGNDRLQAGSGPARLYGDLGNDSFTVNSQADRVFELAGQGSDTIFSSVSYGLQAGQSVEVLATTGIAGTMAINLTGNELAQVINGNNGANTLNGGGNGNGVGDIMSGYGGNDRYIVTNSTDRVFEAAGGGTDTVFTSANFALGAGQSIEVFGTNSVAGTASLHLTGNALAQLINGNNGANVINGGGGADSLYGYGGNDLFVVDDAAAKVYEAVGGGTDTVYASLSYALQASQSVDVLGTNAVSGTAAISLTGNDFGQTINGNNGVNGLVGGGGGDVLYGYGGNDRLIGGAARDIMDGGAGNDTMVYFGVSESTGVARDLVVNMNLTATDKFQFTTKPLAIDTTVAHGALSTDNFDANLVAAIGAGQLAAHHAVLFDPDGGDLNLAGHLFLVVDANNIAGYQAGQDYVIELLNATGTLTTDDFL